MIQALVSSMLGPSGLKLLDWYTAHSLLVNGLLVSVALVAIVFPRQRQRFEASLRGFFSKTPLARSPEDERAMEAFRKRQKDRTSKR